TTAPYCRPVRVVLADPPAYTPWYDHELASALARAGADVELATARFRFGELPSPDGYRRRERFYPLSSRVPGRSRARLPLRAAEHLGVLAWLAAVRPGVLHVQWLAAPQADALVRFRAPAVFTAHRLPARALAPPARALRPRRRAQLERRRRAARPRRRGPRYCLPRLPERRRARGRRRDRPRPRRDPALQGARRRGRGRAPAPGRPPARRRRPGDAARRPPGRAADRVAARLPAAGRARPRPRRGDRRRLPLPGRARPVGRAPAGA